MKVLLVKAKNQSEMKFITGFLKRHGVQSREMDIDDIEDIALSMLMNKADRNKKVSLGTILEKLKAS